MNKKFFFFDIDGTLTNKLTGELVPSAQKTIRQLQEKIGRASCRERVSIDV